MPRWLDILLSIFGVIGGIWTLFQIFERFKNSVSTSDNTQSDVPYKFTKLNSFRTSVDKSPSMMQPPSYSSKPVFP